VVSDETFKRTGDSYRRIRNTARFLLANMNGFDPVQHAVAFDDMLALDRWIVAAAAKLQEEVIAAFDAYQFHLVYQKVHNFCVIELGGFYLDVIKDRQYTTQSDGLPRRSAQTALYHIAEALVRWIAPVLSFTADELWNYLPGEHKGSVFTAEWYDFHGRTTWEVDPTWNWVMAIKSEVNKAVEQMRKEGLIGGALEAEVALYCDDWLLKPLEPLGDELRFALITSYATVKPAVEAAGIAESDVSGLYVFVKKSVHTKCVRCWHHREDVGTHKQHPELCGRCIDNIDGPGEKRLFA